MNRYIRIGIIAFGICIIFIIGLYLGKSAIKTDEFEDLPALSNDVKTDKMNENIYEDVSDLEPKVTYSIISSSECIYLYEISDKGEKNEIASKDIEIDLLPGHDRELLENGINTHDFSEALKVWEGYVS